MLRPDKPIVLSIPQFRATAILGTVCLFAAAAITFAFQATEDSVLRARLEAVSRLNPELYKSSPRIHQLVDQLVDALQDDIQLVPLVIRFQIADQSGHLISVAEQFPEDELAHEAIAYVLKSDQDYFQPEQIAASRNLQILLARNASEAALTRLLPTISQPSFDNKQRRDLITTICRNRSGAAQLFEFTSSLEQSLQRTISQVAITTLAQTPWEDLRTQFQEFVPVQSKTAVTEVLKVEELISLSGNVERGRKVYRQIEFSCVNCHVAEGAGRDIGPPLSEIGTKLGKDALFDAILNPSAGISFDYEGWNLTLNSGDEHSGILLSRSSEEITMKNLLGQTIRSPRSDVFELEKMSTSLMPAGLGQLLGKQNLVDLVAYLSSLRAPAAQAN